MSFKFGRVGVDYEMTNVAAVDFNGDSLQIEGMIPYRGGERVIQIREQLLGLKDNPNELVFPLIYDEEPYMNGFYTVNDVRVSMGPGSLVIGFIKFQLSVTRINGYVSPLFEARLLGTVRPNFHTITNCVGWEAVPEGATGFGPATTQDLRATADGPVRVYSNGTNGFLNDFTRWTCSPRDWYAGSSRIRTGSTSEIPTEVFTFVGDVQEYVVPDDTYQLLIEARGAEGGGSHKRAGGLGDIIQCVLDVTPGETLRLYVGGRGRIDGGGWNGGGQGGAGSIDRNGYGTNGDGWGGGGGTDIRQGGSTSADRVIVAGGGGGVGGHDIRKTATGTPGNAGYPAGSHISSSTTTGRPGSESAGGSGGTYPFGWWAGNNGASGALRVGGNGASAPRLEFYGAGGGGGGYYGGGGGATGQNFKPAGDGGGGSSYLDPAVTSLTRASGWSRGHGSVTISPVVEELAFDRYTVVGTNAGLSTFGWELSNGLVRVWPMYIADRVSFLTSMWNGEDWSLPVEWFVTDVENATYPAALRIVSASVIRNSPEACVVRLGIQSNSSFESMDMTLSLRRGSSLVDLTVDAPNVRDWGLRAGSTIACSTRTGNGLVQTTANSDGTRVLAVTTYPATRVVSGQPGFYMTTAVDSLQVAFGWYADAFTPSSQDIIDQWYAGVTENVRAVLR